MNVIVEPGRFDGADVDLLRAAVSRTLATERRDVVEVSLTLLGDDEMRELNRTYLDHDRTTDVIAFALGSAEDLVGDIYLGVEQAGRQARELDIALDEELVRLAVHGTLHVLGYEHPDGEDRYQSPMFERQERIVRELLDRDGA
jgi:probable rRNA maturation factor